VLTAILQEHTMSSQPDRDDPPVTEASIRAAKQSSLSQLRAIAYEMAEAKGHSLGRWHELRADDCETAYCRNCFFAARIDAVREPHYAGKALSQTCLRPDAFLANQHESVTR
jgi:hypothetical protein